MDIEWNHEPPYKEGVSILLYPFCSIGGHKVRHKKWFASSIWGDQFYVKCICGHYNTHINEGGIAHSGL